LFANIRPLIAPGDHKGLGEPKGAGFEMSDVKVKVGILVRGGFPASCPSEIADHDPDRGCRLVDG
jgi:hypothetical protein